MTGFPPPGAAYPAPGAPVVVKKVTDPVQVKEVERVVVKKLVKKVTAGDKKAMQKVKQIKKLEKKATGGDAKAMQALQTKLKKEAPKVGVKPPKRVKVQVPVLPSR